MREKVEFAVWVKRGYILELDLGYSLSNLDTIKFLDRWPFLENVFEYTSWNTTDTTSQNRCDIKET